MQVEQAVTIQAPPHRVFEALTKDIASWWGSPHTIDEARAGDIVLEARVGGRLYEDWGTARAHCGPPSPGFAPTSTWS